jgi:hypothetical protein
MITHFSARLLHGLNFLIMKKCHVHLPISAVCRYESLNNSPQFFPGGADHTHRTDAIVVYSIWNFNTVYFNRRSVQIIFWLMVWRSVYILNNLRRYCITNAVYTFVERFWVKFCRTTLWMWCFGEITPRANCCFWVLRSAFLWF